MGDFKCWLPDEFLAGLEEDLHLIPLPTRFRKDAEAKTFLNGVRQVNRPLAAELENPRQGELFPDVDLGEKP